MAAVLCDPYAGKDRLPHRAGVSQEVQYRDEIIQVGQYRSNPCTHPLRIVSVLWQGAWYRYVTNVLDPQALSARQVCELYRRRWRIEDAFALTSGCWIWHTCGQGPPMPSSCKSMLP